MRLLATDAHLNPTDRLADYFHLVKFFKLPCQQKILVGDFTNQFPWGESKWGPDTPVIQDLKEAMSPGDVLVEGNHDPKELLSPLFWDTPHIQIVEQYSFVEGGQLWLAIHGYQRSDWALWRFIAPGLVEYMVHHFPRQWYWLCRALHWLPGQEKAKESEGESQRYALLTQGVWSAWEKFGEEQGLNIVIGHTHKAKDSETWQGDKVLKLLDCGDIKTDGSYAVIDGQHSEIAWL